MDPTFQNQIDPGKCFFDDGIDLQFPNICEVHFYAKNGFTVYNFFFFLNDTATTEIYTE